VNKEREQLRRRREGREMKRDKEGRSTISLDIKTNMEHLALSVMIN
jgi:hypothetical protein